MARNRFELEENRKKDALEAVINAAKAGAAYLEPAKATVQKNQSKKTAAKSTGSAKTATAGGKSTRTAQTNPVRAAAVNANQAAARQVQQAATRKSTIPTFLQPKTTRIQPIIRPAMVNPVNVLAPRVSGTGRTGGGFSGGGGAVSPLPAVRGTTRAQRQADLDQLTANSVAWHFADDAQKQALFEANNAIRQKYNLAYLPGTGETYNNAGVNLSAPVAEEVRTQQSYNAQTPLSVLGHNTMAGVAGINRGFYSTLDFLLPDVITPEFVQDKIDAAKQTNEDIQEKVRRYNYERGGKIGGAVGDLYQSALGMIPQAVIAVMSGGTSAAAKGGSTLAGAADDIVSNITRQLTKNAGYMSSFASTVGTDYERAKAAGASDAEAAFSAILSSAATAGIETMGGIDVPQGSASRLRNALNTALEEGSEEVLQDLAQSIVEKGTYNPDKAWAGENGVFDLGRALQNFGAGAILGGGFGAARTPVRPQIQGAQAAIRPNIQQASVDASAAPVRAGKATTIQSPYTGKMPQNAGTEAQTRPLQIGKADVEGAQQAIFASQQGGTFARTMKSVLQNIFQQNGGTRTVTVQGVTFDGQPYDVALGNKVAAKVASDPNMTAEKLAAFNDIDNIVSTAEYVGSGNYNKNKTKAESVKRYDYFEKTLVIDGKPYVATFDVEVYTDRNNFRTYRVIDEMSLTPSTEAAGPQPTSPDGASSFTNNSISQTNGNSNTPAAQNDPIRPIIQPAQGVSPDSSVGAAAANFDPYTRMANEYGTIAQGEAPRAREVDVPQSTDGSDRVRRFARTAMEAQATPEQMIPEFEKNVANGLFSYNPRSDKSSLDAAARTIAQKGYDGALAQWEDVTSGRRTAGKDDIVLAQVLYSEAAAAGDTRLAMQLAAEIAAEGTRAGQSVQALRLLKRTTSEGKLYYIQKAVNNIQEGLNQKRGGKAPQITIDEALAQGLLDAKTDADANAAMDAIYNDVAAQIPATLGDRLNAWRYFAMLGNPRTHIRNVVGNIVYQIPTRASNKVSATLQKAFVKDPNQRTRSLTRNSAAKEFAKADYAEMKGVISGDAYTSEMSEVQRRQKIFPKPLQAVMDTANKALDVEDQIFKRMTYINSMADFLTARGIDPSRGNVPADILEQARTHAIQDAKRATFQDASALADAIARIENKNKATKLAIGGLLPFKRTPINIAKRGFELSPAGLIKGLTYDLGQVRKGTMTATDAIDHISQGLTGTSLALVGYFLASNGLLSASSPENDKERNFEAAQGSQEYALNIGPYSYTIDWAAPAALPMFVGAEFYNALTQKYDDGEQVFKQATDALSRLFEPMINMTMLSGISSTIESATYSQTNPLFAIAGNIAQNYAGQVVPTLSGQIARTIDDTRRTTYADKDSWVPDSVQTFLQRQANKIPGLSQNQPAYTDVWGRPDKTENWVLRAFENFLSPGYIGNRSASGAENALRELYNATGDSAVLPSKPQKSYTVDGEKRNLTADQWLRLSNAKGQTALAAVENLTQSNAYQSMSDTEKVNAVKAVYDYASAVAANQVYGKELEGTIKSVKESGIDPGLYYAYKEMEDALNESVEGYEARDQVFQTIRGDASLSEEQKNQLYHTLMIKGTSDSQWEKYQEISDVVTAEEYVDAMIQSQAIKAYGDTLEQGRATAEATEFSYYLDSMGYDKAKRDALSETFKFYNMFPAEPSNYTFEMMQENGSQNEKENAGAIEASGVSAAQYMTIKSLASAATYEKGKSGAKLAAYGKVVSENTENYDQYAAIMHAMGYKNIDEAYTGAGALPDVAQAGSQVSRSARTTEEAGINPIAAGDGVRLGSAYGYRQAPIAGASTFHEGNDIPAPMGTPVLAYKSGTVSYTGWDSGGGNMVQIDHPDGTKSVYLHLQSGSFAVKPGDNVSQGQQIANVGSTGTSTGPHLDFRIMVNGKYVDPQSYYPGY
ncbi:peptidoglycan DD-metalloendopeptidase family protein [Agathobaculum massiliense]